MAVDRQALGAAIKRLRVARGLTQVELAKAAGLSAGNVVAMIESGRRGVSLDTLNVLAKALAIPAGCLALLASKATDDDRMGRLLAKLQALVTQTVDVQTEMRAEEAMESGRRGKRRAVMGR